MGLLDFLGTEDGRLGLSLLAAGGPQSQPMSLGQRLSGGMQEYERGAVLRRQEQLLAEERKQQMAMRAMQLQQILAQQEEAKAAKAKQAAIEQAYRGAIRSPEQAAMGQFGGPTVAAAQAAPGMAPGIDQQALIRGLRDVDPQTVFQMLQPKPRKLMNVAPGASVLDEADPTKAIFTAPDKADKVNPNQPFVMINGEIVPNRAYQEYELAKAKAGAAGGVSVSYGAPVAGVGPDGKPVFFQPGKDGGAPAIVPGVRPANLVADQEKVVQDKAKTAATAKQVSNTISQMVAHPGLDTALGLSGQIDPRNRIWGTEAKGAQALIEQAQGQAFLQAFESLKGGGQITQIEGEKATAAIARLQRSQKPSDFKAAAKELQDIADNAYKRATGQELPSSGGVRRYNPATGRIE